MNHRILKDFLLVENLSFAKLYINTSKSIILAEYKVDTIVDEEKAQIIIDCIYPHLAKGIQLGMTDATADNINITKEARRLYSNNKSLNATIAHSVVVKALHVRLLTNFFIKFDKPKVPTKIFNEFDKAVEYLSEQLKSHDTPENSSKVPSE